MKKNVKVTRKPEEECTHVKYRGFKVSFAHEEMAKEFMDMYPDYITVEYPRG